MTDTERKLKNVIFRIIDANSITGASLEETRQIFEAIQQAKKEWEKEARKKATKNRIKKDVRNYIKYFKRHDCL